MSHRPVTSSIRRDVRAKTISDQSVENFINFQAVIGQNERQNFYTNVIKGYFEAFLFWIQISMFIATS